MDAAGSLLCVFYPNKIQIHESVIPFFSLFPGSLSLPQINSFVCSSNTSQCFHLSLSAGCELDVLSCAVVML